MFSRINLQNRIHVISKRYYRSSYAPLQRFKLTPDTSINDTVASISQDDLKDSQSYHNIINHMNERLQSGKPDVIKEYDQIYDLSMKLSNLLESTPDVSEEAKKEILNSIIEKFTKYNYAVSTLAFKRLLNDKSKLTPQSVTELIRHNPGRVQSSWQMYKDLKPESGSDESLMVEVLKKMINGDPIEVKEGEQKIDMNKAIKIFQLYEKIGNKNLIDKETIKKLVNDLIDLQITRLVTLITVPSSILESIIMERTDLKNSDYLYLYEASINNGVSLSGNAILKVFMPISKLQLTVLKDSDNLKLFKEKVNLDIPELASVTDIAYEIREQIQELELDDQIKVKLDLIKSAGFHSNDLTKAIEYFQYYQTKVPEGTWEQNDIRSTASLIFVYDCINKDETKMITVAEALIPQSPLPAANNLASLILFHGWFGDSEKAFDIYNKSLDLYMKPFEGNETNRGMLVQSLITVSLMGKELGLAQLIKTKSTENKLIDESYEVITSNVFKQYGDLVEECNDDETKFRGGMKKIILDMIMGLSV